MQILPFFSSLFLALGLTQCAMDSSGFAGSDRQPANSPFDSPLSYGQTYTADLNEGTVTIMEGPRRISTCYTASPYVERTRFINDQREIVVKSRAGHGPATVQLFDTSTGRQQARIMAHEVQGGYPSWAAGMGE